MGKLVRDGIPEIIRTAGKEPVTRVLDEREYVAALLDKVLEEARELATCPPEERLEEAADVYEVLLAVTATLGLDEDALWNKASDKRMERGGFQDRIWLD